MKCPHCGTELPDSAAFCTVCGANLKEAAASPTPEPNPSSVPAPEPTPTPESIPQSMPAQSAPAQPAPQQPAPQRKDLVRNIILIVAGVLLIVFGIMRIVSGLTPKQKEQEPQTQTQTPAPAPTSQIDISKTLNSKGFVTLYAMTELDGENLSGLLEDAGYEFKTDTTLNMQYWELGDTKALFVGQDMQAQAVLGEEALEKLSAGFVGSPVFLGASVSFDNYSGVYDMFQDCANVDFIESKKVSDGVATGYFKASHGHYYLAYANSDDMFNLFVYSATTLGIDDTESAMKEAYGRAINQGSKALADDAESNLIEQTTDAADKGNTVEAPATLTEECFDEHGWVTDYAYLELSGADLVQALKSKGYDQETGDNGYTGLLSSDGECAIAFWDGNAWLTNDEIAQLGKNGEGKPVECIIVSGPFDSFAAAQKSMNACVTQDYIQVSDKVALAVVYGPSMQQNLVMIEDADDGDYRMKIFSQAAIADGAFNRDTEGEYGNTIDEIWKQATGGYVGDYIQSHPMS